MGAPFIPDDALMEFPPGLGARSRRRTGIPWLMSWDAAERPARPEPTTIAAVWEVMGFGVGTRCVMIFVVRVSDERGFQIINVMARMVTRRKVRVCMA